MSPVQGCGGRLKLDSKISIRWTCRSKCKANYQIPLTFASASARSLRSLTKTHRLFQINGKNILIRGAGYSFDLLLRSSPERQQAELKYVRDLNLNTVRLEGKLENDHFFDL